MIKWAAPQGWCYHNSLPACLLLQSELYAEVRPFAGYRNRRTLRFLVRGRSSAAAALCPGCILSTSALLPIKVGRMFKTTNLPHSISISYPIYIQHRRYILPSIPIPILARAETWRLALWLKTRSPPFHWNLSPLAHCDVTNNKDLTSSYHHFRRRACPITFASVQPLKLT